MTKIKIKALRKTLISQERYLNSSEVSMAKHIMRWMNYKKRSMNTVDYFEKLRNRRLKSHAVQARFALNMFQLAGGVY